jgi:hypothetical protein
MPRRSALSLLSVLALAACAHEAGDGETRGVYGGMDWVLSQAEGYESKLAYGVPDTDNVAVMLSCQPKSDHVSVVLVGVEGGARPTLTLGSGRTVTRLPATKVQGMDTFDVEATAPARSAPLARFAETGELTVGVGARRAQMPAADPSKSRRFVESCKGERQANLGR